MYCLERLLFFRFSNSISDTRDSVSSGYPNTEKRVENATQSCLECLIYHLNRNKNWTVNGEVKSSKYMLNKIGYPNLLHSCDFLCFHFVLTRFTVLQGRVVQSQILKLFWFQFCNFLVFCLYCLPCSYLKLHQTLEVKSIFKEEKIMLRITFNPGLTLPPLSLIRDFGK